FLFTRCRISLSLSLFIAVRWLFAWFALHPPLQRSPILHSSILLEIQIRSTNKQTNKQTKTNNLCYIILARSPLYSHANGLKNKIYGGRSQCVSCFYFQQLPKQFPLDLFSKLQLIN